MKKPILFNANGSFDVPVTPIFAQGDYDVYIGALDDDKLPLYVVINRTTNVVEFTTEVTQIYKEWLGHFVPSTATQLPLSFADSNELALKN